MSKANEATTQASALEDAVRSAGRHLLDDHLPEPQALLLLGTGLGLMTGYLKSATRVPLERVPGVPDAWRASQLFGGSLEGTSVWMLEDAPGASDEGTESPVVRAAPWVRGWPCWLAAACGAGALLHTTAGFAVADRDQEPRVAPGTLGLVSDHINVSGHTPLRGLGDSTLGPLFPAPTRLHDAELRASAMAIAKQRGLPAEEVVCACTLGPALETPAERVWLARAGADVAVQNAEAALHASAHAGLVGLTIACVTDAGSDTDDPAARIGDMVAQADRMAPALEELCSSLGPALRLVWDAQTVVEE